MKDHIQKSNQIRACVFEKLNLSFTFILNGISPSIVLVLFQKETDGIDQNRRTCKVKLQFAVAAGTVLLVAFEQWIFQQHWSCKIWLKE